MDDQRKASAPAGFLRPEISLELYRRNPFRVTGLSVDATPTDVRRYADQLRAALDLGVGVHQDGHPLPLSPAPDAGQVRRALARLRDPLSQVFDTFFWFWPGNDTAAAALTAGDLTGAARAWEADGSAAATHNLAVLHHASALDDEFAGKPPPRHGASARWREAYRYWLATWRDDTVWTQFADRVGRLGRPGLDATVVPTVRRLLPQVLISGSAAVAIRGLEQGWDDESVQVHWRLVHQSGLPDDARAAGIGEATDQVVERLYTLLDRSTRDLSEHPATADMISEQLGAAVRPLLRTLELARVADSDDLHDTVAQQLLNCAYAEHHHRQDWDRARTLLRRAQNVARGAAVRDEIREDLRGVDRLRAATRQGRSQGYSATPPAPPETLAEAEAKHARNVEILLDELRKTPGLLTAERESWIRLKHTRWVWGRMVAPDGTPVSDYDHIDPYAEAEKYRQVYEEEDKRRAQSAATSTVTDVLKWFGSPPGTPG